MKRFLLLVLTAGLLIPTFAKASTHNTRDTCARFAVDELTTNQTLRKLNLSIPRNESDPWFQDIDGKANHFCRQYINGGGF